MKRETRKHSSASESFYTRLTFLVSSIIQFEGPRSLVQYLSYKTLETSSIHFNLYSNCFVETSTIIRLRLSVKRVLFIGINFQITVYFCKNVKFCSTFLRYMRERIMPLTVPTALEVTTRFETPPN